MDGREEYLTAVGQICTDVRQVNGIGPGSPTKHLLMPKLFLGIHPPVGHTRPFLACRLHRPSQATAFHRGLRPGSLPHPRSVTKGRRRCYLARPKWEPLLVICTIRDSHGKPVEDVTIDIWEADSTGHYDVQYSDRDGPDGRCVMKSKKDGSFWFKGIKPVPYPIPHDGPVGKLLEKLHRHPFRPSHVHFMLEKPAMII